MKTARRVGATLLGWVFASAISSAARAGGGPETTLLVVNEASWASRTVAGVYMDSRRIPASQIVMLRGVSSVDRIGVGAFREEILGPVLRAIDERGLRGRIDRVVYSVDLPWIVELSDDLLFGPSTGERGSVTGLTYLHHRVMAGDTQYLRRDANRYFRPVIGEVEGKPLDVAEYALFLQAVGDRRAGRSGDAVAKLKSLLQTPRRDPSVAYTLACCFAAEGNADAALAALRDAAAAGWRNVGQVEFEPDLKSVRELAAYKQSAAALAEGPIKLAVPAAFSATMAWGPDGVPAEGGETYLLSTMLGVIGGRGSSVDEVVSAIRRAASADATRPAGTIFLGAGPTPEARLRSWAFVSLEEQLQKERVRSLRVGMSAPGSAMRLAGAVMGDPGLNWAKSESTFLAGAIGDNAVRDGGMILRPKAGGIDVPCTDLIRVGAAGTSGSMTAELEPAYFASGSLQYFYARGFTLAEAYALSVSSPARLLILGDALCAPWMQKIYVTLPGLEAGVELKDEVTTQPFEKGGYDVSRQYAYIDGEFVAEAAAADDLKIDLRQFGDGERVLTVTGVMRNQIEQRPRCDLPIRISNRGERVETSPPPQEIVWGEKLKITVKSKGADWVGMMHLGRLVGVMTAKNGEAVVTVDTSQLGLGETVLRPVAGKGAIEAIDRRPEKLGRGATVGVPVKIAVNARKVNPLPAAMRPPANLVPGLLLSVRGEAPRVIDDCTAPDWASTMKPGRNFELVGYFRIDAEATYQVQLRTREAVELEIDGVKVLSGGTGEWRFAPVRLPAGDHRVRLFGQVKKDPRIAVRMGVAGTDGLSASWLSAAGPVEPAVKK